MTDPANGSKVRAELDLGKRISTPNPPIITTPRLKAHLRGLSSIKELLNLICGESEPFPFCRELALYLLLVASIWPDNKDRLLTAGRIFSAALNFHVAHTPVDRTFRVGGEEVVFGDVFPAICLDEFNKVFFDRIGGRESVLFCPSIGQFHRDVWNRVNELLIVHDVIHFLVKAATVLPPKLRSASFAYETVARNIFNRKGGYGVLAGPKRQRDDTGTVATAGSVREKWKRAPETVILSYVLAEVYRLPVYDLATLPLFVGFCDQAKSASALELLLSSISSQLTIAKATQNKSTMKWARALAVVPPTKPWALYRLSADELERVFRIDQKVHKRPLSQNEQQEACQKAKTWRPKLPNI
jgi:hypothetical protein